MGLINEIISFGSHGLHAKMYLYGRSESKIMVIVCIPLSRDEWLFQFCERRLSTSPNYKIDSIYSYDSFHLQWFRGIYFCETETAHIM